MKLKNKKLTIIILLGLTTSSIYIACSKTNNNPEQNKNTDQNKNENQSKSVEPTNPQRAQAILANLPNIKKEYDKKLNSIANEEKQLREAGLDYLSPTEPKWIISDRGEPALYITNAIGNTIHTHFGKDKSLADISIHFAGITIHSQNGRCSPSIFPTQPNDTLVTINITSHTSTKTETMTFGAFKELFNLKERELIHGIAFVM